MHLNRLRMLNFKKYKNFDIEFQDGLTGIIGRNGAGKSTIVEAIAWALYGSKASTIKRELIKNSNALENESVKVYLDLNIGRQKLRIYRAMKGRKLVPETALYLDETMIATGTRDVDERLEEILKISFQDFMKTFYARQKDLDNLLKEGGMGKREYLLKLLGLDDIREGSVEIVKGDSRLLNETKNKLIGSISEIGDVDEKIRVVDKSLEAARAKEREAESILAQLSSAVDDMRQTLEKEDEKRRSRDLLLERGAGLEKSLLEKREIVEREDERLKKIEEGKRLLDQLSPKLSRLEVVKARLETLEPIKKKNDYLRQGESKVSAILDLKLNFMEDAQKRLDSLRQMRSELEALRPMEMEYQLLSQRFEDQEALRNKYGELKSAIGKELARYEALSESISREKTFISSLNDARARLLELKQVKEDYEAYQRELHQLLEEREAKVALESLISQKKSLVSRSDRLLAQRNSIQENIGLLGDPDALEKELWHQDREMDRLGSELNNRLGELKQNLAFQEARRSEAERNLARIAGLGAESSCPTCERPLGPQYTNLLEKYRSLASDAEMSIKGVRNEMTKVSGRIEGVVASRSRLNDAFKDLNAKKSRLAELNALKRGADEQLEEVRRETGEIDEKMRARGTVSYDQERHVEVKRAVDDLSRQMEEYTGLLARVEELPEREAGLKDLIRESDDLKSLVEGLRRQAKGLGYDESEHLEIRGRLSELRALHDKCALLSHNIQEIPQIESAADLLAAEVEQLRRDLHICREKIDALGFDPEEHEALLLERKDLSLEEERANIIRMVVASENEVRERRTEALDAASVLASSISAVEEQISSIGYSEEEHISSKQALEDALTRLDLAKENLSWCQGNLRVLDSEIMRLRSDADRKKIQEQKLADTERQIEVVETTRTLINRFVDHILVVIREDIARSAGRILDEVTGKYSTLVIDDDFNIQVEDGGSFYPIHRYSGGEIDMIAVSVRVAISEYLMRFCQDGPSYSFLILDEIFGSQDMEHRESMINMLRSLDDRFPQIFAISHISEVQGQFDNTIQVVEDEQGYSHATVG
jgi:exonuclease SbcC